MRQNAPYFQQQPGDLRGNMSDDGYDDGDNDQPPMAGEPFAPREQQSFYPREQQHHQPQQFQPQQFQPQQYQPQHREPQHQPQPQYQPRPQHINRRPRRTSNACRPSSPAASRRSPSRTARVAKGSKGSTAPTGNGYDGSPDRFPLHRRRRRHRSGGPRDHAPDHAASGDNDAPSSGPQSDE